MRAQTAPIACARCPGVTRRARRAACRSRAATACRSRSSAGRCRRRAVPWRRPVDHTSPPATSTSSRFRSSSGRAFTDRDDSAGAAGRHHQRGHGQAVLQGQRPAERAAGDRARRDARVRHRARARRSSASSATRATAGLQQTTWPGDVHPAGAGARRGQRAQPGHLADGAGSCARAGDPYAMSAAIQEAAAPGHRPAGLRRPLDGRCRGPLDVAAALQHVADDDLRRVGAVAGGDRHLRLDGVFGGAAHAGDRHPPVARRRWRRGAPHGGAPGHAAGDRRRGHRPRGVVGAGAVR